ncbi:polar amino acid transport system substrate-binding protein [Enhydrobacter aerosaccus]|uniref:Polar amino acid transport system substrate-binding protein n=1 Tax=Enhydrobacter aerosaccus TaxID=225324 RepID=A0A1T4TI11_9HYPH|nr:transporter substrate-binding domain-containing protein [Enhydrobacter aerosaccus]SKA39891.1 polar amino acid transport system substrate-binding protein [Enhydrobacter aerosaccus]
MRLATLLAAILLLSIGPAARAADPAVLKELAPTGKLRVGVAYGPVPTPVFVVKQADGTVRGVTYDLGVALARSLGVPVEVVAKPNTGDLTEACANGSIDIGFMPADEERRKRVDFSPPYFTIESTYLVTAASGIRTMTEVDRPDVTVVGITGTATVRAAGRSLKAAKIVTVPSVDEAMAMMKAGTVQAFALTHDSLPPLQKTLSGSRILEGAYLTVGVAIGVQKNKPAALAYVSNFVERAKRDGLLRRAFDAAGLQDLPIAPPAR